MLLPHAAHAGGVPPATKSAAIELDSNSATLRPCASIDALPLARSAVCPGANPAILWGSLPHFAALPHPAIGDFLPVWPPGHTAHAPTAGQTTSNVSWPGSSRPSRLGGQGGASLSGIAGTSPAMTTTP